MNKWFKHPQHGFMLRVSVDKDNDYVVMHLLLNAGEFSTREAWEAVKHRMRVNAGCGHLCADILRERDHNPAFIRVNWRAVPAFIRKEFTDIAKGILA